MLERDDIDFDGLTRRDVLRRGAAGALVLGTGGLLAACGSGSSGGTNARSAAKLALTSGEGTPVAGGILRIGAITGGASETLDPLFGLAVQDSLRALQLFDGLFVIGTDVKSAVPALATGAESSADGTVWTVHLRDGVRWHDGKPFTADDVLYTIRRWADNSPLSPIVAGFDVKRMRKRGPLTVEIPMLVATANLPALLASPVLSGVVPDGATAEQLSTRPIGTGPFKFESFQPGRRSEFSKNQEYWQQGKPYFDRVVLDSSFADENARLNALLSNQIELVPQASYLVAKQQLQAGKVTVFGSPSPTAWNFPMRVDRGELSDPRVREAMRLLADRQAIVDGALAGFGTPANDLIGTGNEYYAADLKRSQDVEKAKSLLKAAGKENATFVLQTSPVVDGFAQAATLFAQQAKAAGVTVKVETIPPANYFTDAGGYLRAPFRTTFYSPTASLEASYRSFLMPGGQNDSGWGMQPSGTQQLDALTDAFGEQDAARASEKWAAIQRQQFDEGGLLGWGNADCVNLAAPKVKGLREGPVGFVNNGRLLDGWFSG